MTTILIVDDNDKIRKLIDIYLRREGFTTIQATSGEDALDKLRQCKADLVVADVMMPGLDGFDLLRQLRDCANDIPVIMATAKTQFADKKQGFELGADDYMTKPIDLEELVLRIRALLRRSSVAADLKLRVGEMTLDGGSLAVYLGQDETVLPQKEFQLLYKLLSRPDRTFTRQELFDDIWGYDAGTNLRTVDVHISKLRDRFERSRQFEIVTVHGLGYKCIIRGGQ